MSTGTVLASTAETMDRTDKSVASQHLDLVLVQYRASINPVPK